MRVLLVALLGIAARPPTHAAEQSRFAPVLQPRSQRMPQSERASESELLRPDSTYGRVRRGVPKPPREAEKAPRADSG